MRITTRATYASIDDFLNCALPISWEGFEYEGPVAELKKGRSALNNATTAGQTNTADAQNIANTTTGIANSEVNTSGGLSPLVSKQLASEKGNIQQAYTGASQAANRGLSQRGMGVAPSGLTASITNTGINNEGKAETGATGNAFGTQNELNNTAFAQPLSAVNAANSGVNATTGAASALNKAGSTLGDIGSGLGTVMGAASGLSGLGGIKNVGGSVWGG